MNTQHPQHLGTVELVVALKRVDRRLRTAKHQVHVLENLHAWITNELHRRADAAARAHGVNIVSAGHCSAHGPTDHVIKIRQQQQNWD